MVRRFSFARGFIAGLPDVLFDDPGRIRSESAPEMLHDRVCKELEQTLVPTVGKDPVEFWPYFGEERLHGLLELIDQPLLPNDAVGGHHEEDAILGLWFGGEALREIKCLAEELAPLCHRPAKYPCVLICG